MLADIQEQVDPTKWPIASHVRALEASVIREILKLTSQPGVISFAGGLPAPEMFPLEALKQAACDAIDKYGPVAVQYSLSLGVLPLRELLAERATQAGVPTSADNLIITCGAQQGIELLGRVFVEPGDYILVEEPTFVGALQAFNFAQARYATVAMDEQGMLVDQMEAKIKRYRPKLIYTIPNFQNPTGHTMSLERRLALIKIAAEYGIPVVDDNPYSEIRFSGEPLPSLKSLGGEGVLTLGTFSKILAPGFRIAWMNGPTSIIRQIEKVKQSCDLHTSTFSQYLITEFLSKGLMEPHVARLCIDYHQKRDLMLATMEKTFPAEIRWTRPEGGLFLWVTLPENMSSKKLLEQAVEQKVAYVYGEPFFPNKGGSNTLRLNFSNASRDGVVEGITRLGKLFTAAL